MNAYTGSVPDTRRPGDWRTRAACLGLWEEMHPDNDEHEIAHAKSICAPCPVRVDCLWDAIRTGDMQHGIRAGLRASERRAVAKELELRRQGVQTTKVAV
jgi:WhiB family redox-sensing transcriptional regulator